MSQGKTIADAHKLLQLLSLVDTSIKSVIGAWAQPTQDTSAIPGTENLASRELFNAQRILLSAVGVLTELVSNPSSRLLEVSSQYNESRSLHIMAELRVPDILAKAGNSGVPVKQLSAQIGIEANKLSRLMRCLCSIHIFSEVQENVFANNCISEALVDNEPLRAYIMLFGFDLYTASDHLPKALLDPIKGPSYDVSQTAIQDAIGTTKPRWEWLEEKISPEQLLHVAPGQGQSYPGAFGPDVQVALEKKDADGLVPRPELATFGMAMLGGGRVTGTAHLYDFPWDSLGEALFVDVGGGVGGFSLQLSQLYPKLRFVVQDRAPVLEQAKTSVWPRENREAFESGRVSFVPHDFFEPNPIKGASVYWLRYIIHDWSDDYCVRILSAIASAMGSHSRLLICDQVMNTTLGTSQVVRAPEPLPANYGNFVRWSHQRDITMMSIINGIERTPAQFERLVKDSGLVIRRFWDIRSQVGLVECVLPSADGVQDGASGTAPSDLSNGLSSALSNGLPNGLSEGLKNGVSNGTYDCVSDGV